MSSIATGYSREFRKRISYFPVWQPGDPAKPGMIGRLEKGVFYAEGQLETLFPKAPIERAHVRGVPSQAFYTQSSISLSGQAAGSHPVGAKVNARVSFSKAGGIVYHGANLELDYIPELTPLLQFISQRRHEWPAGTVLVTHVESARQFRILISQSASWEVDLSGDAKAVDALQIADASVSVSTASGSGYQRAGGGPVSLRIYGFKVFGRRPRLLAAGEEVPDDAPFDEISPLDPALDEE
jgi:hypothetical protein